MFPYDWYWRADDGRVFSSAAQSIVGTDDPAYREFLHSSSPTPWPRDEAGTQTNASLQEVLNPYGLFCDLLAYAANARWMKEVAGITVSGVPILTDDRSKQMIMGARVAADADNTFTTKWLGSDGKVYPLTAAQVIGLSNAVLAHVQACFDCFATVAANISNGSVTTKAQVDQAFAAITT